MAFHQGTPTPLPQQNLSNRARKPKLTPHQRREALKRRDRGEPMREIARS